MRVLPFMKTLIYSLSLCALIISCGPAAENREKMHIRAKVFQDSIANVIRQSMAEAEAPGPNRVAPAQPPAAQQPTQAPPQTKHITPGIGVNQTK